MSVVECGSGKSGEVVAAVAVAVVADARERVGDRYIEYRQINRHGERVLDAPRTRQQVDDDHPVRFRY